MFVKRPVVGGFSNAPRRGQLLALSASRNDERIARHQFSRRFDVWSIEAILEPRLSRRPDRTRARSLFRFELALVAAVGPRDVGGEPKARRRAARTEAMEAVRKGGERIAEIASPVDIEPGRPEDSDTVKPDDRISISIERAQSDRR